MAEGHIQDNRELKNSEKVPSGTLHLAILAVLTLGLLYLCYRITFPFLPALAWALALAVMVYPIHRWLQRRLRRENVAAGISVVLVVVLILVPGVWVAGRLAIEARQLGENWQEQVNDGRWRAALERVPYVNSLLSGVEIDVEGQVRKIVNSWTEDVQSLLNGSIWTLLQLLVMVFTLFYFFRDHSRLFNGLRSFSPFSAGEMDRLAVRVEDSIYATLYGMVVIGLLQGATGGLMFWLVGLPNPVLWGVVMAILTVLPMVGAVLVWAPAVVLLLLDQRIGAALILAAWGVAMAGPICNYTYAYLAGDRMRLHPVPTMIAYLGGLAVFGVSGMVLGPMLLGLMVGMIDVWKQRAIPEPAGWQPRPEELVQVNGGKPSLIAQEGGQR